MSASIRPEQLIFVLFTDYAYQYNWNIATYFDRSIQEAIGPSFWNILGMIGLFLSISCCVFTHSKKLKTAAHHLLTSVYCSGMMMLGVVYGEIFSELTSVQEYAITFKNAFMSVALVYLSLVYVVINLLIAYVAYVVNTGDEIFDFLRRKRLLTCFALGSIVLSIVFYFLLFI